MFDGQMIIYVSLTAAVILICLVVLGVTNRRVRYLLSEVQALRQEIRLVDDALKTVNASLQQRGGATVSTDPSPQREAI